MLESNNLGLVIQHGYCVKLSYNIIINHFFICLSFTLVTQTDPFLLLFFGVRSHRKYLTEGLD